MPPLLSFFMFIHFKFLYHHFPDEHLILYILIILISSFAKCLFKSVLFGLLVKRREAKGKGEKERYIHLKAEFQKIPRRDKKAPSAINAKK